MSPISRNPTPPGPVTELFERLDHLHLAAGHPSIREITRRIGRGMISSSTVHNVFRQSRVPSWDYLERIVIALHGDTAEFLDLWQAEEHRTVVFVTHDLGEAIALADRVVLLGGGQVLDDVRVGIDRPRDLGTITADPRYQELHQRLRERLD